MAAITRVLVEEAAATPDAVTVVLHDAAPNDWAEGGRLLGDKRS